MALNYSRQLDRMEARQVRMEMLLLALVQQTVVDPETLAELKDRLAKSEADLRAAVAAQTPPAKP